MELDELIERIKKELTDRKQELVLLKGQEIIRILIKEIAYIESEGNYLNIYTKNGVMKFRETMINMESELAYKGFIRCHKGYLVNSDYIEKLKSGEIEIKYGDEHRLIPVGRSFDKEVRKRMLELLRN